MLHEVVPAPRPSSSTSCAPREFPQISLPDVVALPLLLWAASTLFLVSLVLPTVSLLTAIAGTATLAGFLWLLNVASKGGLGLGDVKAGALIGFLAGATSLRSVWLLGMLAFLGALTFVALSRRRQAVPLGPFCRRRLKTRP